ncbi:hypothetical protein ANO14919_069750 [Xylariales sp. No.14919]|nr:hypothetical protein ANO14919_069750 [Xylariales sp. No.14919]
MTIFHIVLFKFKDDLSKEIIEKARRPLLCGTYGNRGFTHGYICEFDNEEDRTYYLEADPAHIEWVQYVKPFIADAMVVDFVPGVHV